MDKLIKVLVFLVAIQLLIYKEVEAKYVPFGFFKLALQWPSSLCNDDKGCARPPPKNFTIHGLWANNYTGAHLNDCHDVPFVPIQNDYVVEQLRLLWPDIKNGKDETFWKYEWERHGVCSLVWYTQDVYFYHTIQLMGTFSNLLSGLVNNSIVPGPNQSYRLDDIRVVVQKLTTKVPDFYCNYDKDENIQLSEIIICHTPGGTIMDCPLKKDPHSCTSQEYVNFPLV